MSNATRVAARRKRVERKVTTRARRWAAVVKAMGAQR